MELEAALLSLPAIRVLLLPAIRVLLLPAIRLLSMPAGRLLEGCGIMDRMMSLNLNPREPESMMLRDELDAAHSWPVLRALGLASLVVGVTALGILVGRELRQRYKFSRRTPYDFYSNAGDPISSTEYGMGV
jgi:hypothetical protein